MKFKPQIDMLRINEWMGLRYVDKRDLKSFKWIYNPCSFEFVRFRKTLRPEYNNIHPEDSCLVIGYGKPILSIINDKKMWYRDVIFITEEDKKNMSFNQKKNVFWGYPIEAVRFLK